ncbi:G2 M phase-specific E3 ubiquitin- ligase isoform X3 [Paramuricea clavata]|uniref:G2 M phase-specific E3 ubiquitin- ligase isoform X3 n=1 Tax=Paramuricea clavata TaxID=317549 RepID=A0A7D9JSA5_PARCT|nr:G2 M phase-specific E3 ubiquitin- ligase isoform X3 [Paramuricea clavata]
MRINVRRENTFQDFIAIRKKPWFDLGKVFKVIFIGEPAIDDGGPRREFFSEILQVVEQRLFRDGFPMHSITALINDEFRIARELMTISFAQGGPAPCIFTEEVFDYLVSGMESVTTTTWADRIRDEARLLINQVDKYKGFTGA